MGIKTMYQSLIKYGHTDNESFAASNWGTKWNAYDNDKKGNDENIKQGFLEFTTAWSCPNLVVQELSKQNPDKTITHIFTDTDNYGDYGCVTKYKYKTGNIILQTERKYGLYKESDGYHIP